MFTVFLRGSESKYLHSAISGDTVYALGGSPNLGLAARFFAIREGAIENREAFSGFGLKSLHAGWK